MIREEEPPRPSTRLSTTAELPSIAACRGVGAAEALRAGARGAGLDRDEGAWRRTAPAATRRPTAWRPTCGATWTTSRCWPARRRRAIACGSSPAGTRHRSVSAAALASGLVVAVVVLALSNLRIQEEQQRTDEQKQRAEANSRKAREVVDRMFTRVAQDLEHTPRTEKIRRALLEDALEFYQGFLKEKGSDPAVRHETARAYMRVAGIQAVLGRFPQAVEPWIGPPPCSRSSPPSSPACPTTGETWPCVTAERS